MSRGAKVKAKHLPAAAPKGRQRGLLPYQRQWLTFPRYDFDPETGEKHARIKTMVKARRIGGSHAAAWDAINMAVGLEPQPDGRVIGSTPMNVFIISSTKAQARELLREVASIVTRLAQVDKVFDCDVQIETITFSASRCRVRALAGEPSSMRGYTGAVIFDEMAFFDRPDEVWAAGSIIARPDAGHPEGYPVSCITTAWAAGSFVHNLFTAAQDIDGIDNTKIDRMTIDIYEAKRQGFRIDIDRVRHDCMIEETFQVEYCCQWLHGGSVFFDPKRLSEAMRQTMPDEVRRSPSYIGIDVGRTHDLTVAVEVQAFGDGDESLLWVSRMLTMRDVDIPTQEDRLTAFIRDAGPVCVKLDQGLMGIPIRDTLCKRFMGIVWPVSMSASEQEACAVEGRGMLDRGRMRIYMGEQPDEMRALVTELCSIRAKPTTGHATHFETPRDIHGHCDRAWAMLLAASAAQLLPKSMGPSGSVHTSDFGGAGGYAEDAMPIYQDSTDGMGW